MVNKLLAEKKGADANTGSNEIQMFNSALQPTESGSDSNYTNCYCYGPAYPPCK